MAYQSLQQDGALCAGLQQMPCSAPKVPCCLGMLSTSYQVLSKVPRLYCWVKFTVQDFNWHHTVPEVPLYLESLGGAQMTSQKESLGRVPQCCEWGAEAALLGSAHCAGLQLTPLIVQFSRQLNFGGKI